MMFVLMMGTTTKKAEASSLSNSFGRQLNLREKQKSKVVHKKLVCNVFFFFFILNLAYVLGTDHRHRKSGRELGYWEPSVCSSSTERAVP